MRVYSIFTPLFLGFLCIVSLSCAIPKDPFLGIAPEDEKYYQSDKIACRDGWNKFTFTRAQLNDDFCDCPDATDEPGTSACPGGYFYCPNLGHTPLHLFSSRVNDGICDCCDGSDEYDGTVECPNTCWEAGKVARDKLTKKIAIYQEGVSIRKRGIEKAKLDMAKDEAELSKLKSEERILKGLVQQLKDRKEQIEKVEEEIRLEKEKEEKEKKEAEDNANKEGEEGKIEAMEKADIKDKPLESTFDDKIGNAQDSPSEQVSQYKEQIEKAEEKDCLEKENEDKEKKEAEENANKEEAEEEKNEEVEKVDTNNKPSESTFDDKNGNVQDSPSEQDAGKGFDDLETKESTTTVLEAHQHEEGGRGKTVLPEENKEGAAFESESDIEALSKGKGSPDEVKYLETDEYENTKALSSEELGRLVASRWTGENTGKQSEEGDVSKDDNHNEDDGNMPEEAHYDGYDNYASDTDDDSSRYGSDDDDDIEDDIDDDFARTHDSSSSYEADSDNESDFSETASAPGWLEKIQQTVQNLLQAVNPFQTPVDKSEAELVRKEYEESSAQLSKIESRISKLTKKLDLDFGTEKEFYSFYGRCFEGKQNKYIYKVCPYKQASQIETHSTTGLGYWDKFEDVNKAMVFSNGYKCWNGPDRSLKVKLRCGLKNEITDVDEPSRCEYVAILSTPAVCSEEKLKELHDKLERMKKEQPQPHGHDEL